MNVSINFQVMRMQQDIAHMKGIVDRQQTDLMTLNNDIRNRPVVDPNVINTLSFYFVTVLYL